MRGQPTAFALLCLLASCTTSPYQLAIDLPDWRFEGKLSIQEGGRSRVVGIDWQQQGDSSDIHLNGPLGIGEIHILAINNRLIIDSGGNSQTYPMDQDIVIGGEPFRLPWRSLTYWAQGLQGPDMTPIEGLFLQDNWSVSILDSDNTGPILIVMQHPEVRLRLKIRKWQLSSGKGATNQI